MWEELLVIADRLDERGLYAEANEIDGILSMAAMPGGPIFSQLERLMDASGKDTFTRTELNKLMEEANETANQLGEQTYQQIQDEATRISESIKALTDDILKMRDRIRAGSRNSEIYNAYVEDVMKLSNMLTIFNRMTSGARGPEDIQNAERVKQMAGNALSKAQELIKEFYQLRLGSFNWPQKFTQVIDSWNKVKVKRDETAKNMADEQLQAEQSGIKFDLRDSKYSGVIKDLDAFDKSVREDAKELMSYYDMMALVDPEGAKALGSQLGNTFEEVRRMSREELRGD